MASGDARMDGGEGGARTRATAVDIREPLRSLYQNNSNDLGIQEHHSKAASMSMKNFLPYHHRPFVFGSARSASSRSTSPDADDVAHHSRGGGGVAGEVDVEQRSMMSSNPTSNHVAGAEELYRVHSEGSEIQIVDDVEDNLTSMSEGSQSYCFSDSQMIKDVKDGKNLMQLELEAMTWAAMAKDFSISSLEKRLRRALRIAIAAQVKSSELQVALDQSHQELSKAQEEIVKLEEVEERWAREYGESEVDASNYAAERAKFEADQARQHRAQLSMLEHRIRLMLEDKTIERQHDRHSGRPLAQESYSRDRWQGSDADILERELENVRGRERALTTKLSEATEEIEELKCELNDANADLRVSKVLRKTQSRRLKVLEKERRYLLRKGALRTVKLAPHTQRRVEPSMPGGAGWNVFSVLEYEDAEV